MNDRHPQPITRESLIAIAEVALIALAIDRPSFVLLTILPAVIVALVIYDLMPWWLFSDPLDEARRRQRSTAWSS